jgi:predicted DNA binding CopG/RHH family protein
MKMQTKADRTKVPQFATEAEEAKRWDDHKEMVEENLIQAIRSGTAGRGTARRLVREARTSRNVTIRMAEADLDLARKQAEEKGLPYQT